MLIAQITDVHIGFAPEERPEELNFTRFRATLTRILEGPNRPDMMVVSGDITDKGDPDSFSRTAEMLAKCPFPVWPMVGNHDSRQGLLQAFAQVSDDDGFIHYVIEQDGLRIIMLDTLEEGRHGGAFCEKRAAWLRSKLDEKPEMPVLIFMHHPPIVAGIDWMDPSPDEGWIARFGDVLEGRAGQIRAIHCGHLHRPLATSFRGIPLCVTPSVAPLVAMDLRPVDSDTPDNRDLIDTEPPTYALHRWDGQNLVTHYQRIGDWKVLASYTESLKPMIQHMFSERS